MLVTRPFLARPLLLMLLVCLVAAAGRCPAGEQAEDQRHLEYLLDRQRAYRLNRVADERAAELRAKPLFRWNNPISGARGGVFLWTIDDQPVAMTKCHVNDRKRHYVETSVALSSGLVLRHEGHSIWDPGQPALKYVPVAGQPPSTKSARRLAQMRRLAGGFEITDQWGVGGQPYQLRLMPRPLYRYTSPEAGIIDGALFAYAQGTNPEVVVIVEAIQDSEATRWRCGISRLTGYALRAERGGATVYDVKKTNHPSGRQDSLRHHWEQPQPYPFSGGASP